MKYDVYYTQKHDKTYEDLLIRSNDGVVSNSFINTLTPEAAYNRLDRYNEQVATLSSAEMLTDFLFALHSSEDGRIEKDCRFDTIILPHLEENTLALNLETHEIRRVRRVNRSNVELYNNDDLRSSAQEWGYVRIIKEVWDRSKCIPIDIETAGRSAMGSFYYGSALGIHPQYGKMAFEDLCDW